MLHGVLLLSARSGNPFYSLIHKDGFGLDTSAFGGDATATAMNLAGILFGLNLHATELRDANEGDSGDADQESSCAIQKWSAGDVTLHFTFHRDLEVLSVVSAAKSLGDTVPHTLATRLLESFTTTYAELLTANPNAPTRSFSKFTQTVHSHYQEMPGWISSNILVALNDLAPGWFYVTLWNSTESDPNSSASSHGEEASTRGLNELTHKHQEAKPVLHLGATGELRVEKTGEVSARQMETSTNESPIERRVFGCFGSMEASSSNQPVPFRQPKRRWWQLGRQSAVSFPKDQRKAAAFRFIYWPSMSNENGSVDPLGSDVAHRSDANHQSSSNRTLPCNSHVVDKLEVLLQQAESVLKVLPDSEDTLSSMEIVVPCGEDIGGKGEVRGGPLHPDHSVNPLRECALRVIVFRWGSFVVALPVAAGSTRAAASTAIAAEVKSRVFADLQRLRAVLQFIEPLL